MVLDELVVALEVAEVGWSVDPELDDVVFEPSVPMAQPAANRTELAAAARAEIRLGVPPVKCLMA